MRNILRLTFLLAFASPLARAALQPNPRDDFCRRYGHQTTVIDDKLYIDGGWVNYNSFTTDHQDVANTWLSYHDLNNLTDSGWPQLNIDLNKDTRAIPTVAGGVLWGDSVNKKFYVFGGEATNGVPQDFRTLSYDVLYNKWDDLGVPKTLPNVSSYGAGVGVSEVGQGYFCGGWIKNSTMRTWTQAPSMSSQLYRYDYDHNELLVKRSPDSIGRAEGAMAWIPAGDGGLLIYFGGLADTYGNGTRAPQPMNKIFIYDPESDAWFTQTATGEVPQSRGQLCADVAWAPDKSSYNIYVWGGYSISPPLVNTTAFAGVYVLSIPSFTWIKLWPDHKGNATYPAGHYASSCNMVKSRSQMMVIGGKFPNPGDESICDGAQKVWGQHDLWTGGANNSDDPNNDVYWAQYYPKYNTNVVPKEVYNVVRGDRNGGATLLSPIGGYDSGTASSAGLAVLLRRKFTPPKRAATRAIPGATSTSAPSKLDHDKLSKGAIAGIVCGTLVAVALVAVVWFAISRRVQERRRTRRQSAMSQTSTYPSTFMTSSPILERDQPKSPAQGSVAYSYTAPAEMPAGGFHTSPSSPINVPYEADTTSPGASHVVPPYSAVSQPSATSPTYESPSPVLPGTANSMNPPFNQHQWTVYPPPPER